MGAERKSSYEASNEELMDRFMKACAEAGASNSGLVVDFMAGPNLAAARYFRGVVLARLDGVKPPYEPDQQVRVTAAGGIRGSNWRAPVLPTGREYKVDRVWYVDGQWYFELYGVEAEIHSPLYLVQGFELINSETATA